MIDPVQVMERFNEFLAEIDREYDSQTPLAVKKNYAINRFRNAINEEPPVSMNTWELNEIARQNVEYIDVDRLLAGKRVEIENEFSSDPFVYRIVFDRVTALTSSTCENITPYGGSFASVSIDVKRSDIEYMLYLSHPNVDEVSRHDSSRYNEFLVLFLVRIIDETLGKQQGYNYSHVEYSAMASFFINDVSSLETGNYVPFMSLTHVGLIERSYNGNARIGKIDPSTLAFPERTWSIEYNGQFFKIENPVADVMTYNGTIEQLARMMHRIRHVIHLNISLPEEEKAELQRLLEAAGFTVE